MSQPSGKKLDELYKHAWTSGLKTTYYLRTMGATHAEKTTINDSRLNRVGAGQQAAAPTATTPAAAPAAKAATDVGGAKVCSVLDPDCEACQ